MSLLSKKMKRDRGEESTGDKDDKDKKFEKNSLYGTISAAIDEEGEEVKPGSKMQGRRIADQDTQREEDDEERLESKRREEENQYKARRISEDDW